MAALASCILCLYLPAVGVPAADSLETMLAKDPRAEARAAFDAGDKRHIVVPVCQAQGSEVMPGWPLEGPTPPAMWEALRNGRRPFGCDDLGEGAKSPRFLRLLKYAEQYNRELLQLEKPGVDIPLPGK